MKKGSGEHSAVVQAFHEKLDSITETTLQLAKELNERIERARKSTTAATGRHPAFREPPTAKKSATPEEDADTDPAITIDLTDLDELDG